MARFPGVGEEFGRYHVTRLLGRGGMGVVFGATDAHLGREVALKVLNPSLSHDEEFHARFTTEAGTLARLDSVHIVQVYEYGEIDGCLYLATQLIRGGDLATHLTTHGPMAPDEARAVTGQICRALQDAHDAGVVHRDVKPGNVLLRPGTPTHAYLCDFGIAAGDESGHTRTGQVIGLPAYMAPERHHGVRADVRSDLYSVGCVLYGMLTGRPPYSGTDVQVALAHLSHEIPEVPGADAITVQLNELLRRTLAKNPEDRYQTAADLRTALLALDQPTVLRPVAAPPGSTDDDLQDPPTEQVFDTTPETLLRPNTTAPDPAGDYAPMANTRSRPRPVPPDLPDPDPGPRVAESTDRQWRSRRRSILAIALVGVVAVAATIAVLNALPENPRAAGRLTAGSGHTCGIRDDGTAACWGSNGAGQLGDHTTKNSTTPINLGL